MSLKFIKYFNDHIPFHYFSTGSLRCMRQHFLHMMWLHFLILNNYSSLICFWWLYWLEFSSQYLAICKIIDRKFVIFLILLKWFLYFTISILLLLNLWPVTCIVFCSFFTVFMIMMLILILFKYLIYISNIFPNFLADFCNSGISLTWLCWNLFWCNFFFQNSDWLIAVCSKVHHLKDT